MFYTKNYYFQRYDINFVKFSDQHKHIFYTYYLNVKDKCISAPYLINPLSFSQDIWN